MPAKDKKTDKPIEVVSEEQSQTDTTETDVGLASGEFRLFELSRVDPKKLKIAEDMGFPIRQIAETMNAYAKSVETRFQLIQANMPNQENIEQAFKNAMTKMREQSMAQGQGTMQNRGQSGGGGGFGFGDIVSLLKQGDGGGGMDEEMKKLVKDTMRASIDMTNSIKNAIIAKITSKAIGETVSEVV